MVIGVGIDMACISEFRRYSEMPNDAFVRRTFTQRERDFAAGKPDAAQALAGTFAVKEAVCKALAHRAALNSADLRCVEVLRHYDGAPYAVCEGKLAQAMERANAGSILVSITDEDDYACAIAIAQTEPLPE